MIRIYNSDEIPKGYRETIEANNINFDEVKYVLVPDENINNRAWCVARRLELGEYFTIPTITDEWLYVILKDKEN